MAVTIRSAEAEDVRALHKLAAATFPLACPPGTLPSSSDAFVQEHLSEARFAGYLGDPERQIFVAILDDELVGYTMLVFGEPTDADTAAAITARPTAELSKCYVRAAQHGAGVANALIAASVSAVQRRGLAGIWLGVNEHNARANRFYEKNGFHVIGRKKFLVGENWEDDFVRERVFVAD